MRTKRATAALRAILPRSGGVSLVGLGPRTSIGSSVVLLCEHAGRQ